MAAEVKIILHSIGPDGQEAITTQFKYQRFVHAEFMTHREFNRSAGSSRAIPVAKLIEQVRNDPAMPIHWGANQPGMQANVQLDEFGIANAQQAWRIAANQAADIAEAMASMGLHKQVANRVLEPFQWMHVIATTAKTSNFMGLRRHKDAQPEIKNVADLWHEALENSIPQQLQVNEWHLPYIQLSDWENAVKFLQHGRITRDMPRKHEMNALLAKVSAARCARVSYLTHDGKVPDIIKDLELYERLAGSQPIHASPMEHQVTPDTKVWVPVFSGDPHTKLSDRKAEDIGYSKVWENPHEHGNMTGWKQFRKLIPGEYIA